MSLVSLMRQAYLSCAAKPTEPVPLASHALWNPDDHGQC